MFQHIRVMHIDRINSPAAYMDHLNRRSIGPHMNDITTDENYQRKSNDNFAHPLERPKSSDTASKIEQNLNIKKTIRDNQNNSNNKDSLNEHETNNKQLKNGDVKQEDLPTDLSNKRSEMKDVKEPIDAFDVNSSGKENSNDTQTGNRRRSYDKQLKATQDQPKEFLRCNQCNTILPNFESFRDHIRSHLARGELKNFNCFHCGVSFINQNEYELHVSSHFLISTTEYACTFGCNKQFDSSDSLQKHLFDIHSQNIWKCTICFELFESKVGIQIHFAMAHSNKEKTFRCSACSETFETENDFKSHVRAQHAFMFSTPNLQCSLCRTVCSSELEMHFHLATHSRQYRCNLCPESFHVQFLLDRHMQTHHCLSDNINNNMFDFSYSFNAAAAASSSKKLYPFALNTEQSKLFDPNLRAQTTSTSTSPLKLPQPLYELYDNIGKSFYGDIAANKNFMNLYKSDYTSKMFLRANPLVLLPPTAFPDSHVPTNNDQAKFFEKRNSSKAQFACSICDRNDFNNESEMLAHQKVAHNIKTGVSLRCAYCNDNFRSRYFFIIQLR